MPLNKVTKHVRPITFFTTTKKDDYKGEGHNYVFMIIRLDDSDFNRFFYGKRGNKFDCYG